MKGMHTGIVQTHHSVRFLYCGQKHSCCIFSSTMSDFEYSDFAQLAAINDRKRQIKEQRQLADELRKQTAALEKQNTVESDRARIETQRLDIEKQRLKAEDADRELREKQAEQVKDLRNLLADASVRLKRFCKRHLS